MGRDRKENKIRSRRRRAAKDTSETKERPKKKICLLDGVVCHLWRTLKSLTHMLPSLPNFFLVMTGLGPPRSLCLVVELEGERYCPQ